MQKLDLNGNPLKRIIFSGLVFLLTFAAEETVAQFVPASQAVPGARITVAPNPAYEAGALQRWIFGTEYREVWTIPIEIEVMDIGTYAGGLKPLKKGGFGQTTSLHMVDPNGVRYVFRSLDKDPARGLPDDLRYTFVGDVIRDQISSQHPYASLIVPKLLEAVGTLHVTPHVYIMPDDPRLGEFREEFAGLIGAIEERPDDGPDGEPGFAGSEKVSSSSGMYDDLEKGAQNRVDELSFVQARLMDIFLGDRDRHFDQWRWARMENPDGTYRWLPIPKDRDQAFKINDGLMMTFTRIYQRQYVSFGEDYPSIEGASYNGRELDRRLLVDLERSVWDSVAIDLQKRITDDVIESAVHDLPKEIFAYHGEKLISQLKSRRDEFPEMAKKYYELLATHVDLHSSDADDIVEIDRFDDGRIKVYVRTKDGYDYFNRTFLPSETKEVRVLTHGGQDSVVVRGDGKSSITLRVLPGGNDDVVVDQSTRATTYVYDDRGNNRLRRGNYTKFDDSEPYRDHPDEHFLPPLPTDDEARAAQSWGEYRYPRFLVSYSPDFGAVAGGGFYDLKHAFRKLPYKYRWSVFAQAATSKRGMIRTDLHYPDVSKTLKADFSAQFSSMELVHFYGFGNDFSLGDRKPSDSYFKVVHAEAKVDASLRKSIAENMSLIVGPEFRYVTVDGSEDNIVGGTDLYGVDKDLSIPGIKAAVQYDSRDNVGAPSKGVHFLLEGRAIPIVFGAPDYVESKSYGKVTGLFAVYLSPNNESSNPTLALRVGGEKVIGDHVPFFDAAFVGGGKNVRGYRDNRYAGESAAFGNAELRLGLTHVKLIFPWEVGVLGLADAGRVWLDDEDSAFGKRADEEIDEDKIHTAFGGGIWLGILKRRQTLSFSIANGEDETLFYVKAGFHF